MKYGGVDLLERFPSRGGRSPGVCVPSLARINVEASARRQCAHTGDALRPAGCRRLAYQDKNQPEKKRPGSLPSDSGHRCGRRSQKNLTPVSKENCGVLLFAVAALSVPSVALVCDFFERRQDFVARASRPCARAGRPCHVRLRHRRAVLPLANFFAARNDSCRKSFAFRLLRFGILNSESGIAALPRCGASFLSGLPGT